MLENPLFYEYDGTRYEFKLTWGARNEIDKLQRAHSNSRLSNFKDPEVAKLALELEELNDLLESCDDTEKEQLENKRRKVMIELLPHSGELTSNANAEIDPLEIAYIILKHTKAHKDISREKFNELIEDMDENRGVMEVFDFLTDIQEMVFTQMDEMQKRQASKMEKFKNIKA